MSAETSNPVVIVAAKRTAIGSFMGTLSTVEAPNLAAPVIQNILSEAKIDSAAIDDVILGQVLTAGKGQNPARQTLIAAGLPEDKTALTINQVCGSGLRAVAMGAQSLMCDDASIVIAGGQENMSLSTHAIYARAGQKFGDMSLKDTMITDGLWDCFNDIHMGITAENIAEKFTISRDEQDVFAAASQNKAEAAQAEGRFKGEIVPITIANRKGDIVFQEDEFIRKGVNADALSSLRPAFKKDGSVTAGNASGLNDGAAVVCLMRLDEAEKRGLKPLAKIASWATAGVDPKIMGTGPIPASQRALQKAGWTISDLDLIESNEAFAAQSLAVLKELNLPSDIVNVNGGAIALGHPIGASGCRVLVTLLHELKRRSAKKGLATLCIGGGMGIAMCVETVS